MSIELKGLINGFIAAVVALGLVFGLAAIMKNVTSRDEAKQNATASSNAVVQASFLPLGRAAYTKYCISCHGDQGQGVMGPDIRNEDMTDADITSTINQGSGRMPAFKTVLTPNQVTGLVMYVRTLKKK
jgi:mono/diheme cytochrome c family protein